MSGNALDALWRAAHQARDLPTLADLVRTLAREGDTPLPVSLAWWIEREGGIRQLPVPLALPRVLEAARRTAAPVDTDRLHLRPLASDRHSGVLLVARGDGVPASQLQERLGALVGALAPVAARLLELERLRARVRNLEHAADVQRALFDIADLSSSELPMPVLLRRLHEVVDRLIFARNFFIARYDADTDSIRFIYFADTADEQWQEDATAIEPMESIRHSLTWYVIRDGKPLMGSTERLHAQVSGPLEVIGPHAADWLGVPMRIGDEVRGAMVVQSYDYPELYTVEDQALLAFVGNHIATALDRRDARDALGRQARELGEQVRVRESIERQLKHEVMHDALTGLANRAMLREVLMRALAQQQRDAGYRFALLFLDLDRFKVVNDSAGHLVGDALLRTVAGRLAACARSPDVVARLGGDEFAVLMVSIDSDDAPARLAQRLVDSLGAPVVLDGREFHTAASIGVVLGSGQYACADDVLRDADIAMYRAKATQRGRYVLFDEALHRQTAALLALEADLRVAVPRGQLEPYFQPIVHTGSGQVLGFEALVRWNHPAQGVLAPAQFLPVAESAGLMEDIDWHMFERTCAVLPQLLSTGQYVNLNVTPRHFATADFAERLLAMLASHDVAPACIRIEITEGALIDNPAAVAANVQRLHEAGVLTALDDFGSGYSSLGYLGQLQLHALKLDRSFVSAMTPGEGRVARAVARSVLTLAQSLGLEVVAEGIETEHQREALRALGCQVGQGYLFARPQPLALIHRDQAEAAVDA